jgi:hypothetical protein
MRCKALSTAHEVFAHQAWAWKFAGFHRVETIDITAVIDALVAGAAVTRTASFSAVGLEAAGGVRQLLMDAKHTHHSTSIFTGKRS